MRNSYPAHYVTLGGNGTAAVEKRTSSLPPEHAGYIDSLVVSGAYASGSEVVRAGLRALRERDAAIERWLREDAAQAYDALAADPARALTADEVFARLRARHADRILSRSGDT